MPRSAFAFVYLACLGHLAQSRRLRLQDADIADKQGKAFATLLLASESPVAFNPSSAVLLIPTANLGFKFGPNERVLTMSMPKPGEPGYKRAKVKQFFRNEEITETHEDVRLVLSACVALHEDVQALKKAQDEQDELVQEVKEQQAEIKKMTQSHTDTTMTRQQEFAAFLDGKVNKMLHANAHSNARLDKFVPAMEEISSAWRASKEESSIPLQEESKYKVAVATPPSAVVVEAAKWDEVLTAKAEEKAVEENMPSWLKKAYEPKAEGKSDDEAKEKSDDKAKVSNSDKKEEKSDGKTQGKETRGVFFAAAALSKKNSAGASAPRGQKRAKLKAFVKRSAAAVEAAGFNASTLSRHKKKLNVFLTRSAAAIEASFLTDEEKAEKKDRDKTTKLDEARTAKAEEKSVKDSMPSWMRKVYEINAEEKSDVEAKEKSDEKARDTSAATAEAKEKAALEIKAREAAKIKAIKENAASEQKASEANRDDVFAAVARWKKSSKLRRR